MNTEIKDKWILALTSGEYIQGDRELCYAYDIKYNDSGEFVISYENRYSYYGVLCDIYMKETGNGYWKKTYGRTKKWWPGKYVFIMNEFKYTNTIPIEIRSWADIDNLPHIDNYKKVPFVDIIKTIHRIF